MRRDFPVGVFFEAADCYVVTDALWQIKRLFRLSDALKVAVLHVIKPGIWELSSYFDLGSLVCYTMMSRRVSFKGRRFVLILNNFMCNV